MPSPDERIAASQGDSGFGQLDGGDPSTPFGTRARSR